MRLDKFITGQTSYSRSQAKELVKKKQVTVNGSLPKSADLTINEETDEIRINGKSVIYRKYMYIMLNKPAGVICATKDRLSPTVLELLPEELRRDGLFPAGRLDKDTEGFVFITDDGELAHRMLSPAHHVEKEYEVTLEKDAESSYTELFRSGMVIDGGEKCLPAEISFTDDPKVVRLILCEGKFHQVKRMMLAAGNRVTFLKRIRIGEIRLDENLPLGQCREISPKEAASLYAKRI